MMNTLVSDSESDSSSSDESEKEKILEALVNSAELQSRIQHECDGVSVQCKRTSSNADKKNGGNRMTLPSLRPSCTDSDRGFNELNTTPEFRNFVAKKLSQMLDRELETRLDAVERVDKQDKELNSEGIKLFRQSEKKLTTDSDYVEDRNKNQASVRKKPNLLKNRRLASSSDSSDEEKKLIEAAVSCDFIIQQSRSVLCRADQSHKTEAIEDTDCVKIGDSRSTNASETSDTLYSDATVVLNKPPPKKKKKKKHQQEKEIKSS